MIRTADEYRRPIQDGREVYLNGERIDDVVTHAAFKPLVEIRARICDLAHDPRTSPVMAYTDQKGEAHAVGLKLPHTQQDWWDKRRATDQVTDEMAGVVTRVGAVLSQNVTDPNLERLALDLMENGKSAQDVVEWLRNGQPFMEWRQIVLVPATGAPAVYSGDRTLGAFGSSIGRDCASAGHLLAYLKIPDEMTRALEAESGHLADRLLKALRVGLEAGGEAGPMHAAGVQVAGNLSYGVAGDP